MLAIIQIHSRKDYLRVFMGIEIERKFLLENDEWKAHVTETHVIKQGYLQSGLDKTQKSSVRIRISNKLANINVKSAELSAIRQEYEYAIPLHDAEQMLTTLCGDLVIEKTRFYVPYGPHLWEVDVFSGENTGLEMAEIELNSLEEHFEKPAWLGQEVTRDGRYYNNSLIKNPYCKWCK
jgi:adenylate cyclase